MKPKDCEILKKNRDQIYSCYTNPVEHCQCFEECIQYLLEQSRKKKEASMK